MRTYLRGKVTLLFMMLGILIAIPAVALADIVIVNEANIVGDQTKKPGATGTARVTLNNQNSAAGDPVNACNAAGSGNQVSVTLAVRDATTGQADNSITFTSGQNPAVLTGCDDPTTATVEAFDDVAYTVSPTATDKTVEIYVANDPNTTQVDGISGGRTGGSYVATDTLRIRIDGTGPAITITTPPADASYDVDEVVNADFECTDPSGVKSCTGTVADGNAIDTGSAGTKTFTVNAEDNLGNTSTLSRDYRVVNPDNTPPVITPNISGTLGNNGWYKSDVDLTWSVVDNESAISSQSGCDDVSVTSDQNATDYTCTATSAGGTSSETVSIKRDATAPTNIQFSGGGLTNGDTYDFGDVPDGPTGCTANGDISGLKSPGGCVLDGYSEAVGPHTITATAEDNAGNTSEATLSYTVRSWTMTGFYQPVDMNGVYNTVKSGSTVPMKFEVFKGLSPNFTELTDTLSTIGGNSDVKVSTSTCAANSSFDDVETTVAGNTVLRYDTTAGQFVFNWQTPKNKAGSCYKVTIPAKDGVSSLTAYFKLK